MRRWMAVAAALALSTQAACFGSFRLTYAVYDWNTRVEDKVVRSLVMWALIIVPIYELVAATDFVVFNVVEFWSGRNPVGHPRIETRAFEHGLIRVELSLSERQVELRLFKEGAMLSERRFERVEGGIDAFDQTGRWLASARKDEAGTVRLTGPDGAELVDPSEKRQAMAAPRDTAL